MRDNYYYEPTRFGQIKEFVWELIKVVVISLAIIVPVRYFLIQPFFVKGASMEPNFYNHEYLIIDEITYRLDEPQRGDVVVFKYPRDPDQYFIKRIVGLPEEKLELKGGQVYIYNDQYPLGQLLDEAYLPRETKTRGEQSETLDQDEYFVLGDNRGSSMDSRSFGVLKRGLIVGRVWFRGWPFERMDLFDRPEYGF